MPEIAALLVLYAAQGGRVPVTAEQVLAANRARTSIGADPCRNPAGGEEIVVCGRRESPYALPLYDPDAGSPESVAGGARSRLTQDMAATQGACAAQSAQCRPPAAVDFFQVIPGVIKVIKALTDGD